MYTFTVTYNDLASECRQLYIANIKRLLFLKFDLWTSARAQCVGQRSKAQCETIGLCKQTKSWVYITSRCWRLHNSTTRRNFSSLESRNSILIRLLTMTNSGLTMSQNGRTFSLGTCGQPWTIYTWNFKGIQIIRGL